MLEYLKQHNDVVTHSVIMHSHFLFRNHLCIVFELMQDTLYSKVIEQNTIGQAHSDVRGYAKKLIQALHELQQLGVIHADLKPENVLLRDDEVKLGDFGLSCFEHKTAITDVVQTILYRCPEAVLGAGISLTFCIYDDISCFNFFLRQF